MTIQRLVWSFRSRSIGATHRPPERWGFCHPHRPIDKLIISDWISTSNGLIACVPACVVDLCVDPYRKLAIMSRASKATLAATGLGTMGIIWFVHWAQEADRAVCDDSNTVTEGFANLVSRLCTGASSGIWRNNAFDWSARLSSKCKRHSSRSISSSKRYTVRTTTPVHQTNPRARIYETH